MFADNQMGGREDMIRPQLSFPIEHCKYTASDLPPSRTAFGLSLFDHARNPESATSSPSSVRLKNMGFRVVMEEKRRASRFWGSRDGSP
jgi:hypothetical protein